MHKATKDNVLGINEYIPNDILLFPWSLTLLSKCFYKIETFALGRVCFSVELTQSFAK